MKKNSAKTKGRQAIRENSESSESPAILKLRAPTKPGSPLRVEEFPSLGQVAKLSCLLANGNLPGSPQAARELAASALDIWKHCRDELTASKERSVSYWASLDEGAQLSAEASAAVTAFLEKNGGHQFIGVERVSWKEALAVIAHGNSGNSGKSAMTEMEEIVSDQLVGRSPWESWTLKDFKKFGFNFWSFSSLVLLLAEKRARREEQERSEKMRGLARLSRESKERTKKGKVWGMLADHGDIRTSRKKST